MDPLSLAGTFATIVGLIGMFKQERKEKDSVDSSSFLQWLESHKHEELAKLIRSSPDALSEIEKALSEDHEIIIAKLHKIDELLSTLAKNMDLLGGLAESIHKSVDLSDQAIDIIRQLVKSPSSEFMKHTAGGNTDALILMQHGGQINFEEPRFIDDDLSTLVTFGLLRQRYGSKGSEIYCITRDAVKLVDNIARWLLSHTLFQGSRKGCAR